MIFRALFFIAIVAVLMPHQPDLGLGQPSYARSGVIGLAAQAVQCNTCAMTPSAADGMTEAVLLSLAKVRADIAAAQRDRAALGDFRKH